MQSSAQQSNAKQSKALAKQGIAKQSKAKHSKAKHSKAKQSKANPPDTSLQKRKKTNWGRAGFILFTFWGLGGSGGQLGEV